jgi:hypothetical protein
MTWLTFHGPFGSKRLAHASVPVLIHTPDLKLVKTVMSSEGASLDPGTYVVTARLPAGQEIVRVVEARGDLPQYTVDLRGEDTPPLDAAEVPVYVAQQRTPNPVKAVRVRRRSYIRQPEPNEIRLRSPLPNEMWVVPEPPKGVLRAFAGNPLHKNLREIALPATPSEKSNDVVEYVIAPAAETRWVQLIQMQRAPVNIALPVSRHHGCILTMRREANRYWIDVHLENADATLLLGYQQNRAAREEAVIAERLFEQKLDDPVAAMAGAYSLLRGGELNRLRDWTKHLMDWMPWIPDGAAIRGEHLARLGSHKEAVDAFLKIAERGIPMFSDGLSFAIDRLRLYARSGDLPPTAKDAWTQLAEFATWVDFAKIVTTYTGLNPAKPEPNVFRGTLPAGIDCAKAFD